MIFENNEVDFFALSGFSPTLRLNKFAKFENLTIQNLHYLYACRIILFDNYFDASNAEVSIKNIYFENIRCDSEGQLM